MTIIELRDQLNLLIEQGHGDAAVLAWAPRFFGGNQDFEPADADYNSEFNELRITA